MQRKRTRIKKTTHMHENKNKEKINDGKKHQLQQ